MWSVTPSTDAVEELFIVISEIEKSFDKLNFLGVFFSVGDVKIKEPFLPILKLTTKPEFS